MAGMANLGVKCGAAFAVAVCVAWLCSRLAGSTGLRSCSAWIGLLAGWSVSYVWIVPWSDLNPSRHFHWGFYVVIAGTILAALLSISRWSPMLRWLPFVPLIVSSLFVLVPRWQSFSQGRWVWQVLLGAYLLILLLGCESASRRLTCTTMHGFKACICFLTAGLVANFISLTLALPLGAAGAAILGYWTYVRVIRPDVPNSELNPTAYALSAWAFFALVAGCWCFFACIELSERNFFLLLPPLGILPCLCLPRPILQAKSAQAHFLRGILILLPTLLAAGRLAFRYGLTTPI